MSEAGHSEDNVKAFDPTGYNPSFIFELLWRKCRSETGSCPRVSIPNTIVFSKGAPLAWYERACEMLMFEVFHVEVRRLHQAKESASCDAHVCTRIHGEDLHEVPHRRQVRRLARHPKRSVAALIALTPPGEYINTCEHFDSQRLCAPSPPP